MPTDVWLRCKGDGPEADKITPLSCPAQSSSRPAVAAVQITQLNRLGLSSWLNRIPLEVHAKPNHTGITIFQPGTHPRTAVIGDWLVVQVHDSQVYALPESVFHQLYEVPKTKRKKR